MSKVKRYRKLNMPMSDIMNVLVNVGMAFKVLSERDRKILLYRSGLYDGHIYTLQEVGEIYDVTRERIRQLEAVALHKIKLILDYEKDRETNEPIRFPAKDSSL